MWPVEGGAAEWQTIPKLCEGDAEADDGFQDLQNRGETSQISGKTTAEDNTSSHTACVEVSLKINPRWIIFIQWIFVFAWVSVFKI